MPQSEDRVLVGPSSSAPCSTGLARGRRCVAAVAAARGLRVVDSTSQQPAHAAAARAPAGGGYGDVRLQRVRRGAEEGLCRHRRRLHQGLGHRRSRSTRSTTTRSRRNQQLPAGQPDDVFTWFAGYRMRFFADQGLVGRHQRRVGELGSQLHRRLQDRSTGNDGKQYFVPFYYYPWAVLYRKSLFEEKGYTVPTRRWTSSRPLGDEDEEGTASSRSPSRDKDGWPAMGTFDIPQHAHQRLRLPRRPHGGQGDLDRRQGQGGLHDLDRPAARSTRRTRSGRTWQDAAQALQKKKAGMYLLGMFVAPAVHRAAGPGRPRLLRLPRGRLGVSAPDALEAPIDGFMMAQADRERRRCQGAAHVPR